MAKEVCPYTLPRFSELGAPGELPVVKPTRRAQYNFGSVNFQKKRRGAHLGVGIGVLLGVPTLRGVAPLLLGRVAVLLRRRLHRRGGGGSFFWRELGFRV